MSDILIQFTEGQFVAMPEADRQALAALYAMAVGAPDLLPALRTSSASARSPELVDFINARQLTVGGMIECRRPGVRAEVAPGGALFDGVIRRSLRSLFEAMTQRKVTRGRKPDATRRLFRVNSDGSRTSLFAVLPAVQADMRARDSVARIKRVLGSIGNPRHQCPRCGDGQREVSRVVGAGGSFIVVTLLCGHVQVLAEPKVA